MSGLMYRNLKDQWVEAFQKHLDLMVLRRKNERTRDVAITFMEDPPEAIAEAMKEDAMQKMEAYLASGQCMVEDDDCDCEIHYPDDAGEMGEGGEKQDDRYLQFAFMKKTFFMEIPNNTIWPAEVRRLFAMRHGFFRLRQRRWPFMCFEEWKHLVKDFDPVQKEYLNADTRSAAEDMAWIIFDLWRLPIDGPLYFRTLRFGRARRDWEGEGVIRQPSLGGKLVGLER